MTLTPIRNKALIQFDAVETVSDGGILLVPPAHVGGEKQDWRIGIVLAIGLGRLTRKGVEAPVEFAVGDRVLITDYHTTGTGVKDRHLCEHKDVAAVLEAA